MNPELTELLKEIVSWLEVIAKELKRKKVKK